MTDQRSKTFESDRQAAEADPTGFWSLQAKSVDWFTGPTATEGGAWFVDGTLNAAYEVLDRHVIRGLADEPALVLDSDADADPRTRAAHGRTVDYADLLEKTAQLGGVLRGIGIQPGDSLLVHLPRIPELVIALLACARTGIVAVVVDPARTAAQLANRIDAVRPGVILTTSCVTNGENVTPLKPVLDAALDLADHAPVHCLVVQRPQHAAALTAPRDLDVSLLMKPGGFEPAACAELAVDHPLDASGAGHGPTSVAWSYGLAQAGIGPEDLVLTTGDVEQRPHLLWAPLLAGAAILLSEPDLAPPTSVAKAVARHGVTALIAGASVPQTEGSARTVVSIDPAPWWLPTPRPTDATDTARQDVHAADHSTGW